MPTDLTCDGAALAEPNALISTRVASGEHRNESEFVRASLRQRQQHRNALERSVLAANPTDAR